MSVAKNEKGPAELVDEDGRSWVWDPKAKVWYAPDWGLEFATRDEIVENYGLADSGS